MTIKRSNGDNLGSLPHHEGGVLVIWKVLMNLSNVLHSVSNGLPFIEDVVGDL